MKLSTKSRYALEGILYMVLYSPNEAISLKQIAQETEISFAYLEQIFFKLRKAGILNAERGAKGGFTLAFPSNEITVGQILYAIEGDLSPVACVHDLNTCKSKIRGNCVSRQVWIKISSAIEDTVNQMTLQDLANKYIVWNRKNSQKG